jgi:pantoate--beta-alanine ligase
MRVVKNVSEMQTLAEEFRNSGSIIGFVPTMGFLHEGHLSLMRNLRKQCDVLVVSIFVNPTQFAANEDLAKYPRDFQRDQQLCRAEKVDVIFYPSSPEMYPEPYRTFIQIEDLSKVMCGHSRPDHFRGVATVVAKLFNIVKPHLAIFGEKDYQQAVIIRQMVKDLNFDVQIITAPIVREKDGLAMSSRNKYLSGEERKYAPLLYQSLLEAKKMCQRGVRNPNEIMEKMTTLLEKIPQARIDYIALVDPETLTPVETIQGKILIALAVNIGSTRLIDNIITSGLVS